MANRLFDVKVHYLSDFDREEEWQTVTIMADDDILAREKAIEVARARDKAEARNEIKKVIFCETEYMGIVNAQAHAKPGRRK